MNCWQRVRRHPVVSAVALALLVGLGVVGIFQLTYGADTNVHQHVVAGGTRIVGITLRDFDVVPGTLDVEAGARVVLEVTNRGSERHDLAAGGRRTSVLAPGEHERLDLGAVRSPLQLVCTLPFHRTLGMVLRVRAT